MLEMMEYYNMLREKNINIIYSGPLWADGVEGIGLTLKRRLSFTKIPLSASQAVFSVFVEQMNNMLMYSAEKEEFSFEDICSLAPKGVFILGTKNNAFFLQSGNVIKSENTSLIKSRIDHLNTLNKAELRKYYKEQIRSENDNPESKGGGIGLIEIARRASSPIEYDFKPYGDGLEFFTMFVII